MSDLQCLILSGIMGVSIFVFGLLEILDNFIVLTVLTIIFLAIIVNLISIKAFPRNEESEEHQDAE